MIVDYYLYSRFTWSNLPNPTFQTHSQSPLPYSEDSNQEKPSYFTSYWVNNTHHISQQHKLANIHTPSKNKMPTLSILIRLQLIITSFQLFLKNIKLMPLSMSSKIATLSRVSITFSSRFQNMNKKNKLELFGWTLKFHYSYF